VEADFGHFKVGFLEVNFLQVDVDMLYDGVKVNTLSPNQRYCWKGLSDI